MPIFMQQSIESPINKMVLFNTDNIPTKNTQPGWIATVINNVNQFQSLHKSSDLARVFKDSFNKP